MSNKERVCPAELAGSLDNRLRRWIHNPEKILKNFIFPGMTVLDVGCGPGLFTIEMAKLVGIKGKVIAADLQKEMLDIVRNKVASTELQERVQFVECTATSLNVTTKFDFALAFYMVHEVPDKKKFFSELKVLLNVQGKILIVEPKIVHVSKKAFELTQQIALETGLKITNAPKVFGSQSIILTN
jgi:ubiquinone/menaquinone biosynthesis C-methylase UbiE